MEKINKETLTNTVGTRLKELRKAKTALGQKEVADELGITKQALSNYESGRNLPDHTTMIALAKYYSCTTDYLYGLTDKATQDITDYSKRESINLLLHAFETVAEDEGDYIAFAMTKVLESLSISQNNPQRNVLTPLAAELNISFAECVKASTSASKRLSQPDITPEDLIKEFIYFYNYNEMSDVLEDIQQAIFSVLVNFSSSAKKKLRIRRTLEKDKNSTNL